MGGAEASWNHDFLERHGAYVRSMVEKMVHDGVPDDMNAQSLFDQSDISQEHDEQNSRILPVTMGACHATENP